MMKTLIADASIAVKLIFEEKDSGIAHKIFNKVQASEIKIIVPELFYCEVANACWVKFRKKLANFEQTTVLFERILNLNLERRSDLEYADVALENAMHYQISAYDGLYVALAEAHLVSLVTADENLIRACRAKKFNFVESLQEVELP